MKIAIKKITKEFIELHPHQPRTAYALSVEELSVNMSYKTFKRFLKKTQFKLQKSSKRDS